MLRELKCYYLDSLVKVKQGPQVTPKYYQTEHMFVWAQEKKPGRKREAERERETDGETGRDRCTFTLLEAGEV